MTTFLKLDLQRFAVSTSKSTNLYSSGYPSSYPYTLTASFTENSVNTANNTSNITVKATLKANGQRWSTSYNSTLQIYWHDNNTNTDTLKATTTFAGLETQTSSKEAKATFNITHKTDGTLKGYAKAVFTKGSTTSSNAPASGNVQTNTTALTSIARVSGVSCTSPYVGDTAIITINRSDNSYTDTVTYTIGTLTGTIATKTSETVLSLDTSSMKASIYNEMSTTSQSIQGTITIQTYNASDVSLGTKTATFNLYAKEDECKPTISATIVDTNATTIALTGDNNKIVTGYSNAQVTYTITPRNNATLTSKTINGETLGVSPYTITGATTGTFNIVATDSRNFSTTETITKTTVNYVQLGVNINALYRTAPASDEVQINFQGNYYNGSFGSTTNSLTLVCKYRIKGDANWTTLKTLVENTDYTISDNTFYSGTGGSASDIVLDSNVFAYQNIYEVAIFYQDAIVDTYTSSFVPKGVPIMNWEDGLVNVNGTLTVSDTDGNNPVNVLSQSGWQLLGSKTGNASIALPSTFNELYCEIIVHGGANTHIAILIPYGALSSSSVGFNNGYYQGASTYCHTRILATTTSANCSIANLNGTDRLSTTTINYYYR